MDLEGRVKALELQIGVMDDELARVSAESLGFRYAFIALSSLIPATVRDVTAAHDMARRLVDDAILSDGIPHELALSVLSTIHQTMEIAGFAWRSRASPPPPGTPRESGLPDD